jgi:hypothetical protein
MLQIRVLQTVRTIPFVTFVITSFHDTTFATPFLGLPHGLARCFQMLMIFEARGVSKVSIAHVAGNPRVVRDAVRNGRAGIARCVTPVLRATHTPFVTRKAQISLGNSLRQVRDYMIVLSIIQ